MKRVIGTAPPTNLSDWLLGICRYYSLTKPRLTVKKALNILSTYISWTRKN